VNEEPPNNRPWNVLALASTFVYTAGLALLALAALSPGWARRWRPPFDAYADPSAWWPILVQLLLGLAAFGAYYLPRRHETRSFSFLITSALGVTTIVLALFATWRCVGPQAPFFTPLAWALGMVLGGFPSLDKACTVIPLALQVGRLFGPLLLVVTALGIVATIFRTQSDLIRVRYAASLVVLVGLTDDAMPLLRRLLSEASRRTTVAVLVEDAANPLVKMARDLGSRVVVCDLDRARMLQVLLIRQARLKARALYLVSSDASANLAWARQFRQVADSAKPSATDQPPRMIARIDDPWQAEYWRRTNAYRTPDPERVSSARWMSDALSVYEVTAAILVEKIQSTGQDRLALVGNSPLAVAVCAELAQRQREDTVLGQRRAPSLADLVLLCPEAADLRRQHQVRQERFGNAGSAELIAVVEEPATEEALAGILSATTAPAVILADDPNSAPGPGALVSATLLAALHPRWTIFDWSTTTRGVADEPIMERLYLFGLTMEPPPGWAVDSWERAARVVHERYLRSLERPDPEHVPSHRPWAQLDQFLRDDNVRLVTTTLAGAESVGRSWGPVENDSRSDPLAIPDDQMLALAEFEHASWLRQRREQGWRYGPVRSDADRIHPAVRPWSGLDEENRRRTQEYVRAALETLYALGYRSSPLSEARWIRLARRGEVAASQLASAFRWITTAGEELRGRPGDWRVRSDEGDVWTVEPKVFAETYEHLTGDRYCRVGTVAGRPATAGEVITSLEGSETAREGDWVICGSAGEQWIISADHLRANYSPLNRDGEVGRVQGFGWGGVDFRTGQD
jgi:hypothetical protein